MCLYNLDREGGSSKKNIQQKIQRDATKWHKTLNKNLNYVVFPSYCQPHVDHLDGR